MSFAPWIHDKHESFMAVILFSHQSLFMNLVFFAGLRFPATIFNRLKHWRLTPPWHFYFVLSPRSRGLMASMLKQMSKNSDNTSSQPSESHTRFYRCVGLAVDELSGIVLHDDKQTWLLPEQHVEEFKHFPFRFMHHFPKEHKLFSILMRRNGGNDCLL